MSYRYIIISSDKYISFRRRCNSSCSCTYSSVSRVLGTGRQRSRRSWNSSTGGAGTAIGTRPGPLGCRSGWTPGVPRRAGIVWPGRRTGRTRRRTSAVVRWATPAVTATRATAARCLPAPPGRRRRHRRPLPRHRRRNRSRLPIPVASTAPVVRTTANL